MPVYFLPPAEKAFVAVGCYRDSGRKPRPMPKLVKNMRSQIDWHNLQDIVVKCAQAVKEKG